MNSRRIDNKILTIRPSGWTYDTRFILYDMETESMWYPVKDGSSRWQLLCIAGEYADRKLYAFNATLADWEEWKQNNPQTKYLDEAGLLED